MKIVYQESTRCPSCGYTHSIVQLSDKSKGKPKIHLESGEEFSVVRANGYDGEYHLRISGDFTNKSVTLACPDCGSLFVSNTKNSNTLKYNLKS